MKFVSSVYFLALPLATVKSANVAISSDQVAVVAGAGLSGLVSIQLPDGQENIQTLPAFEDKITAFEDVTIDPENPTLVFTMGEADQSVCGWTIESDASLVFVNCVVGDFGGPYSGISANAGTLVISGGNDGFTVYSYDTSTGVIAISPNYFRKRFNETTVLSSPDVLLIDGDNAALSSQFIVEGGPDVPRFGTLIVNLVLPEEKDKFKVANSLGTSDLAISPSNYPLENALYTRPSGQLLMFTANGAVTVQDPFNGGSTIEVVIESFSAITIAMNQEKGALILGGVNPAGDFSIRVYSIGEPSTPVLIEEFINIGRVASVASSGDIIVYSTFDDGVTSYGFEMLSELPPTAAPEPTLNPTQAPRFPTGTPTVTAQPTTSPSPTISPSISSLPTTSPEPTVSPTKEAADAVSIKLGVSTIFAIILTGFQMLW